MRIDSRGSASLHLLRQALRAVEPGAVVVQPRLLRRVLKRERHLRIALVQVPHKDGFVVSRDAFWWNVRPSEAGMTADEAEALPRQIFMLPAPPPRELYRRPVPFLLRDLWRSLFHLRVHAHLEGESGERTLDLHACNERIHQIGQAAFDAARRVMEEEARLLPPRNAYSEYVEFASTWWEHFLFEPERLGALFPDHAPDPERVRSVLARDVDGHSILAATRPEGAAELAAVEPQGARPMLLEAVRSTLSPAAQVRAGRAAERARNRGNHVRAAWHHQRAAAPGNLAPEAVADLDALVARLVPALSATESDGAEWREALLPLLVPAARRKFSPEVRLLYDLQRVAIDHERGVLEVDLLRWMRSRGREPWKFPLPHLHEVRVRRHFAAAEKRVDRLSIDARDRHRLEHLLEHAGEAADERLRKVVEPTVTASLEAAGVIPNSVPERVAQRKVVRELLDRAAAQGYLALGDVRDAVSRNQIKLNDCAGFRDYRAARGLLTADRKLGSALPELYRPGEFYLRSLLRVSTLSFGTKVGRRIVTWCLLPFGAAFTLLFAVKEMAGHIVPKSAIEARATVDGLVSPLYVALIGIWLLGLLHSTRVQVASRWLWRGVVRALKLILVETPRFVLETPAIRQLRESRWWRRAWRHGLSPALAGGLVGGGLLLLDQPPAIVIPSSVLAFAVTFAFLSSRLGVQIEERIYDTGTRAWDGVRRTLFQGLVRLFLNLFERARDAIERALYAVDEALRFRRGEAGFMVAIKAVVGIVWRAIRYVIRFYITLLVEPQINPIKHFPVVTVAHKLTLPFAPLATKVLGEALSPFVGSVIGNSFAAATVLLSPGLAGFIVWELKENWKLFRANQSVYLQPVRVGHHGETIARFLRPGFHSGTLPKLYAKKRKLEARVPPPSRARMLKVRHGFHHAEDAVRRFLERELIAWWEESGVFPRGSAEVLSIHGGYQRLLAEIIIRDSDSRLLLEFDEQSGLLLMAATEAPRLADPVREEGLRLSLLGLAKLSAADLLRSAVEAQLPAPGTPYDINDDGLVIWPKGRFDRPELYPMTAAGSRQPPNFAEPRTIREILAFRRAGIRRDRFDAASLELEAGRLPTPAIMPGHDVRLPPTPAGPTTGA